MTQKFNSPYVFINTEGRPILQDKLRETWARVLKKAGLPQRRMYETRHTFASWALAGGETPEWVAKTLGHVDTSMVYRTYCRYIPNLTRQDGSAFERFYQESPLCQGSCRMIPFSFLLDILGAREDRSCDIRKSVERQCCVR
jgi:integrase